MSYFTFNSLFRAPGPQGKEGPPGEDGEAGYDVSLDF